MKRTKEGGGVVTEYEGRRGEEVIEETSGTRSERDKDIRGRVI